MTSSRGGVRLASEPQVPHASNARVSRCAVIRDDVRQTAPEPLTAAEADSCALTHNDACGPGYRIVHDDETLALMQELAQYSEEYKPNDDTVTVTDNDDNPTPVDSDSHVVVNRVVNQTDLTSFDTPIGLSKMHYRDVLVQEIYFSIVKTCLGIMLNPRIL